MKKTICIILTLVLLVSSVSVLFAQGGKESSAKGDATTTIQFMNWGSAEEATKDAFAAMIADFEAKNPTIKVENVGLPFNQMFEQLLILNAGGNPPDVAQLHGSWVSALQSADTLTVLDDRFSPEFWADFYPAVKDSLRYGGKLYASPWSPSPVVLYYNKTLLAKAGYTEGPKTMSELFEMATAISNLGADEKGNTIYGLGVQSKKMGNAGFYFLPYLWDQGGDLVDAQGNVTIDSPAMVKALSEIQVLFDKKVTPAGLEIKDLRNLFAQGNLGFHFDGDFGYATFLPLSPKKEAFAEEIGICKVPGDNTGFFIEHNLGIFEKSKKKEAAAKFVEYLSGPEAMDIYNQYGGNKTPARYSVAELPYYKDPKNAHMQQFIVALEDCRALPQKNAGFSAAMEEIAEAIQRVGINHENPSSVVPDMAKKITRIYLDN